MAVVLALVAAAPTGTTVAVLKMIAGAALVLAMMALAVTLAMG